MIYRTGKCPVCGNIIKCKYINDDDFGIVEECIDCHNCGYYYLFAYGNYLEYIGNKTLKWSYRTHQDNNTFSKFARKQKRILFMARRNWKKDLKKKHKQRYHKEGD